MRLLHLTPELPYWPGGSGGSTRQFHLLRRLAELGHDVTVVAPATSAQLERVADLEEAGIRALVRERPQSRVHETAAALAREPALVGLALSRPVLAWQVSVFWHRLRGVALRAVDELRPDVISVEHDNAAAWATDLPPGPGRVLILQNLGWRYYRSRAAATQGVAGVAMSLEARRFHRFDLRRFGAYDALVTVSEHDASELRSLPMPVRVVPNGVSTADLPAQPPTTGPPALLFTGTMAYPPNAEAALWFAREVWPLIKAEEPGASFTVVGRDPPERVRRLARDSSIKVTGAVPDVAPYFARSTAVVAPVLSGGGTRLKLLEAWSAGRAVVATAQAAEGLEFEAGRHALIEDDPALFAGAVVRVLHEPALREGLSGEGRRLVEERYDWRLLGDRLEEVLRSAAG